MHQNVLATVSHLPVVNVRLFGSPHKFAPVTVDFQDGDAIVSRHCKAGMLPESLQSKIGLRTESADVPPKGKKAKTDAKLEQAKKPTKVVDHSKVPLCEIFEKAWAIRKLEPIALGAKNDRFFNVMITFIAPDGSEQKRDVLIARLPDDLRKQVEAMVAKPASKREALRREGPLRPGKTARDKMSETRGKNATGRGAIAGPAKGATSGGKGGKGGKGKKK